MCTRGALSRSFMFFSKNTQMVLPAVKILSKETGSPVAIIGVASDNRLELTTPTAVAVGVVSLADP